MNSLLNWKSGTTAFMAMVMATSAIVPLFTTAVTAQQPAIFTRPTQPISQSKTVSIPTGVTIPVTFEKDKIVVTPDETTSVTLEVAQNVVDGNRNVLIPARTKIEGELQPRTINNVKGSQFVAKELVFSDGRRQSIDATSRVVTKKETIKKGAKTGTILTDAAIGAGAASIISLLTGNKTIEVLEPIIGAAVGAGASAILRKREAEVVVIDPQQDLDVTLNSNLIVSRL
ncbi:MAG: conjugal transfer protein TrbI [Nostochopsis sp.]